MDASEMQAAFGPIVCPALWEERVAGQQPSEPRGARKRAGKRIVTASGDNTARVWNAAGTGAPIVLEGHEGQVNSAAWSPDGERIVTASRDWTARVWSITIPALQQALRDATTDCLTPEQRQTYLTESESDARKAYEACERSHGRTPYFADTQ